jgi:hypothetical protein
MRRSRHITQLQPPRHQCGQALMIMLIILVIGALTIFVNSLNSSSIQISRDKVTADALAQAKDALIGYAVTYGDSHTNQVNGYLPMPDLGTSRNNNSNNVEGNTAGNFSGNAGNLSVLGRLPWQALDIAPLRDANGECLWYAVSGAYQNAQKTDFMNWDTVGQFETFTSDGTSSGTVGTTGTNYHQQPVAIIFAPGATLSNQDRSSSTTDTVTQCGGNYNARNYLDTYYASSLLNSIVNYFSGSTNNSTGTYTYAAPKQFVIGPVSDTSQTPPLVLVNDKLLTITPADIFNIIKKRSDFGTFVYSLLSDAVTCMSNASLPAPIKIDFNTLAETAGTTVGNLNIGRMPKTVFTGTGACSSTSHNATRAWRDNLLYATCNPSGTCLTVNGLTCASGTCSYATGLSCSGIVIFAGERTSSQNRAANTDKNTWSNYLEDTPNTTYTAFTQGAASFSGPSSYSASSTSSDIVACIP